MLLLPFSQSTAPHCSCFEGLITRFLCLGSNAQICGLLVTSQLLEMKGRTWACAGLAQGHPDHSHIQQFYFKTEE